LTDVHPHAELAADATEAAGAQDAFWPLHDTLPVEVDVTGERLPPEVPVPPPGSTEWRQARAIAAYCGTSKDGMAGPRSARCG
jgi:hypothetical protein